MQGHLGEVVVVDAGHDEHVVVQGIAAGKQRIQASSSSSSSNSRVSVGTRSDVWLIYGCGTHESNRIRNLVLGVDESSVLSFRVHTMMSV